MSHEEECGCCEFAAGQIRALRELIEGLKLGEKLNVLHAQLVTLDGKADQIMTAQQDVNAADSALQQLVAAAPAIIAAVQAGGTPVATAQLATDTTAAAAALASIQAAMPAPVPVPAPVPGPAPAPPVPASPFTS
jgi:hypothetical protein